MNLASDIVSDPVCPWCIIGKHRLTSAIALVQEKYPEVRFQFNWLPYFLNPDMPPRGEPYRVFLEAPTGSNRGANKRSAGGSHYADHEDADPRIVFGLISNGEGCSVTVEVSPGPMIDRATLSGSLGFA